MLSLLKNPQHIHKKTMIFCNSVTCCNAVEHALRESGFKSLNFHREVPIIQRKEQWKIWKQDPSSILVCTDIASRGLDTTFVRKTHCDLKYEIVGGTCC